MYPQHSSRNNPLKRSRNDYEQMNNSTLDNFSAILPLDNCLDHNIPNENIDNTIFNTCDEDIALIRKIHKEINKNLNNYYTFSCDIIDGNHVYKTISGVTDVQLRIRRPGKYTLFLVYSQSPVYVKEEVISRSLWIRATNFYYIVFIPRFDL